MAKSFRSRRDPSREHLVAASSEEHAGFGADHTGDFNKSQEQAETSVSCWAKNPVLWVVLTVMGFSLVIFLAIYFSVTAAKSPGSANGGGNNGNSNIPNQGGNSAGGRDARILANLPAHYIAFSSEEPQTAVEVQDDARLRGPKASRERQKKFVALSPEVVASQPPTPPRQLAGQTVGYYSFASIPGTITVNGETHDKQWLLDNLLVKQQTEFRTVLQELERLGRKKGHYIWWVVPSDRWGQFEARNERTAVAKDACKELFVRQKYKTLVLYEKILEKFLELLQNNPTGRTDPASGKKIPNAEIIPGIDFGKIRFWILFYQRSCEDADWVPGWYKDVVARWDQYKF
ncbi:unnamed protein product [Amoebophrya sp. A120]|nr:unnamed protein product [Amoebophrya sp. A120]|eukprot:GSA120T00008990001.1